MHLCGYEVTDSSPFFLIAGPCVLESEGLAMESSSYLKAVCDDLRIPLIFKSSFDKANRSSHESFKRPRNRKGIENIGESENGGGCPYLD